MSYIHVFLSHTTGILTLGQITQKNSFQDSNNFSQMLTATLVIITFANN